MVGTKQDMHVQIVNPDLALMAVVAVSLDSYAAVKVVPHLSSPSWG